MTVRMSENETAAHDEADDVLGYEPSTDDDIDDVFGYGWKPSHRLGQSPLALGVNSCPSAVRASDIIDNSGELVDLVEGLCPAGELGIIGGESGAYKSTVALHLAAAIAGGNPAFNRFATIPGQVLIISAEDSGAIIRNRLDALIRGHDWDAARVLNRIHIFAECEMSLVSRAWQAHLRAECARLTPILILADPWAELIEGDENSNSDARPVIKFVRSLSRECGATPYIIHHASKGAQEKKPMDRLRGAGALGSAARVVLYCELRDDSLHVECLKQSRGMKPEPFLIEREIVTDPANRLRWKSARFTHVAARHTEMSRAEQWVLGQIAARPRKVNSTQLQTLAEGSGNSKEAVNKALQRLNALGKIDYITGADLPKGRRTSEKLWFTRILPSLPDSHPVGRNPVPTVPTCGQLNLPTPLKGVGRQMPNENSGGPGLQPWEPPETAPEWVA